MKNIYSILLSISILLIAFSCGDDDFPVPEASSIVAKFSYAVEGEGFAPANVTFTNESTITDKAGEVSYAWNFGDGTISNDQNPVHEYTSPGTFTVSLTITSADDLDFFEQSITIRDPNALLVQLYFLDAGSETINQVDGGSFSTTGSGRGLEYDATNDLVYYTDRTNGSLVRVNRDGTDEVVLVDVFTEPRDLAIDFENNKAYITDRGSGVDAVWEVDLSNNQATVLYDPSNGLGTLPVGRDFYAGNLYITCVDFDAESVWVGNVDGSGVTRIIDYAAGGFGYGIEVDEVNEKIYFDNNDGDVILRANLDGTEIQEVVSEGGRVYGIAIDNSNGKIYWTDEASGSVFMADLDGSNPVTLTSDFDDPRGLFFIE